MSAPETTEFESTVRGTSDAAEVIDFAARTRGAAVAPLFAGNATAAITQYITTPDGRLHAIQPAGVLGYDPGRPIGRTFEDLASLVAYVGRWKDDTTEAYVHPTGVLVELDGTVTEDKLAGPGRHRAAWPLVEKPAFKAWTGIIGKAITQDQLAEVLDEWLPTVVAPDAATMLELVQGFAVKSDVEFRAGQRLRDGSQTFSFTVDNQPHQIVVPEHVDVAVEPYHHVAHQETVRLKFSWRLREGKLTFTLKNADWPLITERARATLVEQLTGLLGDVPVYAGR